MESRAQARFIRQSAPKVRKTLDMVRGKDVETALNMLHFSPVKASDVIEKTIRSAVSNFLQTEEGKSKDPDSFFVKEAYVDEGPTQKRFRPASMGRISRIRKRSSHLTVVLGEKESSQT